jgi:hypothetical protein
LKQYRASGRDDDTARDHSRRLLPFKPQKLYHKKRRL